MYSRSLAMPFRGRSLCPKNAGPRNTISLYVSVCVCECVCVTLLLNVEAKMEDLSADLPQSLASLLLMSTSIPHAFHF